MRIPLCLDTGDVSGQLRSLVYMRTSVGAWKGIDERIGREINRLIMEKMNFKNIMIYGNFFDCV